MRQVSVREYAAHRGVTEPTVRNWMREGRIVAIPELSPTRIDLDDADARLEAEAAAQAAADALPLLDFSAPVVDDPEGIEVELPPARRVEPPAPPPTWAPPRTEDGRLLLTVEEYATHRGATNQPGATKQTVHEAIKNGRISATLYPHPQIGRECYVIDPELADREWIANSKQVRAADVGTGGPESRRSLDYYKAENARLDFEARAGSLISKDKVKAEWARIARTQRDRLSEMPARASSKLFALVRGQLPGVELPFTARAFEAVLQEETRNTLTSIANEVADAPVER